MRDARPRLLPAAVAVLAARSTTGAPPPEVEEGVERFLELEASGWRVAWAARWPEIRTEEHSREPWPAGMAAWAACRNDALLLDDAPIAMGIVASGGHATLWKTAFEERFAFASHDAQFALDVPSVQERDRSLRRIRREQQASANSPLSLHR